jgi:hypothetical protein
VASGAVVVTEVLVDVAGTTMGGADVEVVDVEVVDVEVVEVEVVDVEVVDVEVVEVVVDVLGAPTTVMLPKVPDTPEASSMTINPVVSASTRVTLAAPTPAVNSTLLPLAQSP